ncbi:MAG: DUF456 domain-containing protein [Desulfohalobiaceae bacterium]
MSLILTLLFLLLLLACWLSNLLSLPGNWINVLLIGLWGWLQPQVELSWSFLLLIVALAALAEGIEFVGQLWGSKRFGGSNKGNFGSLAGTFVGALLGAPFFLGLGAILGALAGAFLGSLVFELVGGGKGWSSSVQASFGALVGRAVGFAAKIGLGLLLIVLSLPRIWP